MSSFPPATHPTRRFRDWASVRHGLVWAYEGPVLPAAHTGTYASDDFSCWLIRRGQVVLTTAGQAVTARAGDWACIASPRRHQAFSADAEILSVHFHFTWPGGEPVIAQRQNVVIPAEAHPQLERAALPLVRLVRRHFPGATAFLPDRLCTLPLYLEVQNRLPRWLIAWLEMQASLGQVPRRAGGMDDRVLQAVVDLDRQPLSRKFSEKALVAPSGLGRSQLNALFVEETGLTPRRYFDRRKQEGAERLLAHTGQSVKEIALGLGFRHESHFCTWFRSRTGRTPSGWRAGHGKLKLRT